MRRLASMQTHHNAQHDTKSISDNPNPEERRHKPLKHSSSPRIATTNQDLTGSAVDGLGCQLDYNNNSSHICSRGEEDEEQEWGDKENMGSNVSRHNGKGLSGRRSLSSGKCTYARWSSSQISRTFGQQKRRATPPWQYLSKLNVRSGTFLLPCSWPNPSSRIIPFEPQNIFIPH